MLWIAAYGQIINTMMLTRKEELRPCFHHTHTHTHTLNNGNSQQVSLFTMEWWGDGQAVQSRSTDQGALDLAMSPSLSWCAINIPCRAPVKSIQHLWSVSRYEFDSHPLALPVLNINKPHVASVDISITIKHKLKRPPAPHPTPPPRKKGKINVKKQNKIKKKIFF